ncbi:MAG: YbhB/YbcL family Raf kinase inhibitor-like protein [Candidatus Binataceae bacterium]
MKHGRVTVTLFTIISLMLVSGYAAARTSRSFLKLTSPAFAANSSIPAKYTCNGDNQSPPLSWSGVPEGTRSYIIILEDPDAAHGPYIHWVLYNLPEHVRQIPAGIAQFPQTLDNALNGANSAGGVGYTGPCPPSGPAHHYVFHLMALNSDLNLKSGATAKQVEKAAAGHILGSAKMTALYGH